MGYIIFCWGVHRQYELLIHYIDIGSIVASNVSYQFVNDSTLSFENVYT